MKLILNPHKKTSKSLSHKGAVISTIFGIMVEGKSCYENIGEKHESLFFREAMELRNEYAKEIVRLYVERMAANADEVITQLKESSAKIIKQKISYASQMPERYFLEKMMKMWYSVMRE